MVFIIRERARTSMRKINRLMEGGTKNMTIEAIIRVLKRFRRLSYISLFNFRIRKLRCVAEDFVRSGEIYDVPCIFNNLLDYLRYTLLKVISFAL